MEIKIRNLTKYYEERKVLDIDKMIIEEKKITGLIGPNGSGKSTLLNIVAGLDNDYLGCITYNGERFYRNLYLDITLVSQKPYLFRRKVYDNVAYPLKIRGISKERIKERTDNVLKELDIYHLKDKKGNLLSGGESQKVSLARALVFEPKLILLDEPTSNIDENTIRAIETTLLNYNKKRKSGSVIIVTHNREQAIRLCDEIIYINQGKVEK